MKESHLAVQEIAAGWLFFRKNGGTAGKIAMKGDPKLIESLNALLSDELTAINQYIVHSEMCGPYHRNRTS